MKTLVFAPKGRSRQRWSKAVENDVEKRELILDFRIPESAPICNKNDTLQRFGPVGAVRSQGKAYIEATGVGGDLFRFL